MDKIRESESIIEELEDIFHSREYILNLLSELKDNIVSRDAEIETLKQDCKNLIQINNNQAEIMKLGRVNERF